MNRVCIYILFSLFLTLIPLKAEAQVEKIGTKNIKVVLSEDIDMRKGFKYQLPLRNASGKEQTVYYELTGFKTKENKPITVKLYETVDGDPTLTYNGANETRRGQSTFINGDFKKIILSLESNQDSDEYSGKLTIYSYPKETGTSFTEDIEFYFEKYKKPKKELLESDLEVNNGSKETIYINKVIGLFTEGNEENMQGDITKSQIINLANKTKEYNIENVIIQPSFFERKNGNKKTREFIEVQKYKKSIPLIGSNKSEVVSLPLPRIRKPGTYNIKFNIQADNINPQQIDVTVQARYGTWVAVVIIVLGGILSYFVTRGIIILRTKYRRNVLINKIRSEVEDYNDDNVYLKERIRALTSISSDLNRGWVIVSEEKINGFLDLAQYLLDVGKRKGEIWYKFQDYTPHGLIEEASKHLREVDRLVAKFDVMANETEINSRLDKAEEYTKEDKRIGYWPKLKERIDTFIDKIGDVGGLSASPANDYIKELREALVKFKDKAPVIYESLQDIELNLMKLDLVWENKDRKVLVDKLVDAARKDGFTGLKDAIYILKWEEENDTNWKKIIGNNKQRKIRINPPLSLVEDEVGVFTVDFGDDALNNSYLVRKYLTYDWKFKHSKEQSSSLEKNGALQSINKRTNSLAKYLPEPETWDINLEIRYGGHSLDSIRLNKIVVKANKDIKGIRQISKVEMSLSLAALFLAVLSALQTEYTKKPDFGSFSDMIALFMWAVAFDQGKNMLGWIKDIGSTQKQS